MMGFNIHDLKIISFINFAFLQSQQLGWWWWWWWCPYMFDLAEFYPDAALWGHNSVFYYVLIYIQMWPYRRTGLAAVLSANANKLGQKVVSQTSATNFQTCQHPKENGSTVSTKEKNKSHFIIIVILSVIKMRDWKDQLTFGAASEKYYVCHVSRNLCVTSTDVFKSNLMIYWP